MNIIAAAAWIAAATCIVAIGRLTSNEMILAAGAVMVLMTAMFV